MTDPTTPPLTDETLERWNASAAATNTTSRANTTTCRHSSGSGDVCPGSWGEPRDTTPDWADVREAARKAGMKPEEFMPGEIHWGRRSEHGALAWEHGWVAIRKASSRPDRPRTDRRRRRRRRRPRAHGLPRRPDPGRGTGRRSPRRPGRRAGRC